jgi:ferritin-like metal-binding protein YciE
MTRMGRDQLAAWLDDAHAMESGLISILQTHATHVSHLPDAARRLEQHVVETQQHVQRVNECLRLLGTAPSGIKSALSAVVGSVEGASTAIFRDEVVKDALADYASEQFEVACYTALVSMATALDYPEIARLCNQNLQEDRAMAEWLLQQLPSVVIYDAA